MHAERRKFLCCRQWLCYAIAWLSWQAAVAQLPDSLRAKLNAIPADTAQARFLYDSMRGYYNFVKSNNDALAAERCAAELKQLAGRSQAPKVHVFWLMAESVVARRNNKLADAISYARRAIEWAALTSDPALQARSAVQVADIYRHTNQWDKAFAYYLRVLRQYETQADSVNIGYTYAELAEILMRQNEPQRALTYAQKSLQIFRRLDNSDHLAFAFSKMGSVYERLHQPDSAIVNLRQGLKHVRITGDKAGEAVYLGNLALQYFQKGNVDVAIDTVQKAIEIAQKLGLKRTLAHKYAVLGSFYKARKQYDEAETMLRKSYELYQSEEGLLQSKLELCEELAALYLATQKNDRLATLYPQLMALKDSVYQKDKAAATLNLTIQYETEKKEQQITTLQTETRQRRRQLYLWAGIAVLSAVAAVLMYRAKRLQSTLFQQKETLLHREKAQSDLERQLEEAAKQQIQLELELKHQQLTSSTLFARQKNELLEALTDQLNRLMKRVPERHQESVTEMRNAIRQNLRLEQDREELFLHFDQVHASFFNQLKQRHPELSSNDLKQCAYLKLNLNNKEIANLLNIEVSSVKMSHYRLKKKMSLTEGNMLKEYILSV